MKLTIDLDDIQGCDSESVTELISDAVRYELRNYATKVAKDELKKHKAQIEKEVKQLLAGYKLPPLKDLIK